MARCHFFHLLSFFAELQEGEHDPLEVQLGLRWRAVEATHDVLTSASSLLITWTLRPSRIVS